MLLIFWSCSLSEADAEDQVENWDTSAATEFRRRGLRLSGLDALWSIGFFSSFSISSSAISNADMESCLWDGW